MEPELKVGDVVRLKAGGPAMTISQISGSNAECVWFTAPLGWQVQAGCGWSGPHSMSVGLAALEKTSVPA